MKQFLTISQKAFKRMAYYKAQNLLSIFTALLGILMMQFFWRALYGENSVIHDTSVRQMLLYSSMSWFLNLFNHEEMQNEILSDVKEGNFICKLLYPVNYLFYMFSKSCGCHLWSFFFKGIPMLLFILLFVNPGLNLSAGSILLFAVSAILGNLILCALIMLLSLMSFTWIETSGLFMLKDIMVTIFSGLIVPTWFYPQILQRIVNVLPFQYMLQVPLAILCGRIAPDRAGSYIGMQAVWLLAMLLLLGLVWKKIAQKAESLGG
ncbi:MAG TPA: ABC-2 family transporter protein [Candidatus Limivivens intestinipullorum]|uniref:ABC-2 family transporter protein n=1 Tax=Candidatus Limivivens intestinipullorum TaxID=2840858 RepID=A0A9D1EUF7_9FIRM|nr:ABC-2 family transporter protein [Candidatus Limivivens intestinipullorum]